MGGVNGTVTVLCVPVIQDPVRGHYTHCHTQHELNTLADALATEPRATERRKAGEPLGQWDCEARQDILQMLQHWALLWCLEVYTLLKLCNRNQQKMCGTFKNDESPQLKYWLISLH